jgi:hypothetical protein
MTYPAPEILEDDPWFGPAPDTEKSLAIKKLIQEKILEEEVIYNDTIKQSITFKEPENIHEVLYQVATKNVATTLSLNPINTFGGGSEMWMSGVGQNF